MFFHSAKICLSNWIGPVQDAIVTQLDSSVNQEVTGQEHHHHLDEPEGGMYTTLVGSLVAQSPSQQHHGHVEFLLQIRLKGGIIGLIVLLSRAALMEMYHLHFVRQVIHLDAATNLMS